jgi:curved DNA-binding protein CbpA
MAERDAYDVLEVSPRAHDVVIKAAYRALAGLYHPDRQGDASSQRHMSDLNAAFDALRTPERREVYDRIREGQSPAATVVAAPGTKAPAVKHGSDTLDFGRYEGWTIAQLASEDPDYLQWLSRHSSGIRYRQQIQEALQNRSTQPTMQQRVRGRGS